MFTLDTTTISNAFTNASSMCSTVFGSMYSRPVFHTLRITRARSYWMKISKNTKTGTYGISVSNLFENYATEEDGIHRLTESFVHELIHTLPGAFNHGYYFKKYGELFHKRFPEYEVSRATSPGDNFNMSALTRKPKYVLTCRHCGKQYNYYRKCGAVECSSLYCCRHCGRSDFTVTRNY